MLFKANLQAVRKNGRHNGTFREADIIFTAASIDDAEFMMNEFANSMCETSRQLIEVNSVYPIAGTSRTPD